MARLPQVNNDSGVWGEVLNDFLSQAHDPDGTLKDGIVTDAIIADGTITENSLDSALQAKVNSVGIPDNSVSTAKIQNLAITGDKIANTTITNAQIANSAAIAQSKVFNLTTDLAGKASNATTITGTTSLTGGGNLAANRTLSLVNDNANPGNSYYYGTNSSGTKGYFALPAGSGATTLSGLTDINLTAPANGEVLKYNGNQWVNTPDATGGGGANAFITITDGITNATADSTTDTFKLRSANNKLSVVVGSDDPTHGDNALFTVNEANFTNIPQSAITNLSTDFANKADVAHTHEGADITAGTIDTARLGSGAASAATYLRGDQTWTPVASGISPTLIDAKGDLIVGTANDTAGRLAVGANNKILAANSATASGLAWVDPVFIDIRSYGAVGDGVTNDTAAFNAALTAAGVGGAVYIPPNFAVRLTATNGTTVSGRTIFGGGTIVGASLSTLINVGSNTRFDNIRLLNDTGSSVVLNFTGGASNVVIENCTIGGNTAAATIAIHMNTTGISRVTVRGCRINLAGYGILTNTNANDLNDFKILNNTFTNIASDAIELNSPNTAYNSVSDVIISGNYISVTNGSGTTAGFGVGIAGATRVTVTGNTFESCRNQAVHIEDEAAHIIVSGNTFTGSPYGIWALDGDNITISDNSFYSQTSTGINMLYDSTNQPTRYVITGNTVYNSTGAGIHVGGDGQHYGIISQNVVSGCGGNGIQHYATGNQPGAGNVIIESNISTGNARYGLSLIAHSSTRIQGNITNFNTLGAYFRESSAAGTFLPITNPTGEGQAVIAGGLSDWITLFPLGLRATGTITVTANRLDAALQRTHVLMTLTWDGTTLTTTPIGTAINNGATSGITLRVDSGNLQGRAASSSADGQNMRITAQLHGMILM